METANICVKDIIGSKNAILHSDGLKLYNVLHEKYSSNNSEKIIVDFKDINNLTSGFCNASVGKLFNEIPSIKKGDLIIYGVENNYLLKKIEDSIDLASDKESLKKYNNAMFSLFE